MSRPPGFTLLEVLVALVLLTIGLLVLTAQTASLLRALARARRAEEVTVAATARLEQLRATGCVARTDGSESVRQGAGTIARLDWGWSPDADSAHRLRLVVTPAAAPVRPIPAETLTLVLRCR